MARKFPRQHYCGYRVNYGQGQVSSTFTYLKGAHFELTQAQKDGTGAFIEFRECDTGEWFQLRNRARKTNRVAEAAAPRMDSFTRAYFDAVLWSSSDNSDDSGGEPLDKNYSISDIADETRDEMIADCASFQDRFVEQIGSELEQAGQDFWLTRNGDGVGFWDGGWPEPAATELTNGAKEYGEYYLYVDDDGQIHGQGNRMRPGAAEPTEHRVADFNTLDDLIHHAHSELGATHVSGSNIETKIYFPRGGQHPYEEAKVWRKGSYWHAEGPGSRTGVKNLPNGARAIAAGSGRRAAEESHRKLFKVIGSLGPVQKLGRKSFSKSEADEIAEDLRARGYDVRIVPDSASHDFRAAEATPMRAWDILRGGTVVDTVWFQGNMDKEEIERALEHDGYERGTFQAHPAEARRGRIPASRPGARRVRDYEAIDRRDRVIAGPFKSYSDAKNAAGTAGSVRFVPSKRTPPRATETPKPRASEARRPKAKRSARRRR